MDNEHGELALELGLTQATSWSDKPDRCCSTLDRSRCHPLLTVETAAAFRGAFWRRLARHIKQRA